ncbi:MAG: siderophore-interacting protein [Actinomycetota bacterium]|nr:siderophore-interacting protein [Actinomycetota bacterium]
MPEAVQKKSVRRPILTEVDEVTPLTPHMVRIVLTGDELSAFRHGGFTDSYVKLQLPPPGAGYSAPFDPAEVKASLPRDQWFRQRTYTVRDWDPVGLRLTIDFVHHGDSGLAGPWANRAIPGDRVQIVGPGGDYSPDPQAPWHLLAGDDAAIPAITVALGQIPPGVEAHVFLEVEDETETLPVESSGDLILTWLYRKGQPHAEGNLILGSIKALDFPEGTPHAFIHGEAGMVRAVRKHLVLERGVPKESMSATGYWKYSRTEEGWREDKPQWKKQVEADLA